MGKPRYKWWNYAKSMIKAFPDGDNEHERKAVSRSLQELEHYPTAEARRSIVTQHFFGKQTIQAAAEALNIPPSVAKMWISNFIHSVWHNFCDLTSD